MPSDELDLVLPGQYFSTLTARYAHLRSYLNIHMHIDIYTPIICLDPPSVTSIRLWVEPVQRYFLSAHVILMCSQVENLHWRPSLASVGRKWEGTRLTTERPVRR